MHAAMSDQATMDEEATGSPDSCKNNSAPRNV